MSCRWALGRRLTRSSWRCSLDVGPRLPDDLLRRGIDGIPGFSHCAVRVVDSKRDLDVTIELVPEKRDGKNMNEPWWHSAKGYGPSDAATDKYRSSGWAPVARPDGMSEEDFDNAVLNSAYRQTQAARGKEYSSDGSKNSNHFVYQTITGAGGKVPGAAVQGKTAPGICGGSGLKNGTNCSSP
jgi:hypothetical protein